MPVLAVRFTLLLFTSTVVLVTSVSASTDISTVTTLVLVNAAVDVLTGVKVVAESVDTAFFVSIKGEKRTTLDIATSLDAITSDENVVADRGGRDKHGGHGEHDTHKEGGREASHLEGRGREVMGVESKKGVVVIV